MKPRERRNKDGKRKRAGRPREERRPKKPKPPALITDRCAWYAAALPEAESAREP